MLPNSFELGQMRTNNIVEPAAQLNTKSYYESHAQHISLGPRYGQSQVNAMNVFQPNDKKLLSGNLVDITKLVDVYPTDLVKFVDIQLNTAIDPIKMLGRPVSGSTWRPLNGNCVPKGFGKYRDRFKFYKIEKTHINIKFTHLGDSSNNFTGMPIQLYGYRVNTHNRNSPYPDKVPVLMEHPHGFKIGGPLFPSFSSNLNILGANPKDNNNTGTINANIVDSISCGGTSYLEYNYTYDPNDVTTQVDLDGDTANKALWSANDASPIEEQKLIIYAVPLFAIRPGSNVTSPTLFDWHHNHLGNYMDAYVDVKITLNHTIQFRDPIYGSDSLKVETLNGYI